MKKHLLIIIILLVLVSTFIYTYSFKEKNIVENPQPTIKDEEMPKIEKSKYIDNNPIKLGLYKYYSSSKNRELISEYQSNWEYHKDISSFEVFFTQESSIPSQKIAKLFDTYRNNYENIDNYRIGYIIEFNTIDTNINKTVISPKDTEEFFDYLEIYLYDDYHRTGGWYSHTTESEFNDNTLLTSIKLTAGKKVEEITTDIIVTAFTYIKDDFDNNNNYLGKSKYQIIVKNKIN